MEVSPESIFLAVGPFEVLPDPKSPQRVTHFCLPGKLALLKQSVKFLHDNFSFFEQYLDIKFPFKSYKQVFVEQAYDEDPNSLYYSFSGVSVFSGHLLHDKTMIDEVYKTRKMMSLSLAEQYYGCFVSVNDYHHLWVTKGMAMKLSFEYIRKAFGNNEYHSDSYLLIKELEEMPLEAHQRPLVNYEMFHPCEFSEKYYTSKAFFVVRLMEELVSPQAFINVHKSILKPHTPGSNSLNSYLTERSWSTKYFLRVVKNLTGYDMQAVYERWVIGSGILHLQCGFTFNEKEQCIEFASLQDLTKARFSVVDSFLISIFQ